MALFPRQRRFRIVSGQAMVVDAPRRWRWVATFAPSGCALDPRGRMVGPSFEMKPVVKKRPS